MITPYSDEWPHKYNQEAKAIKNLLGDTALEVHHIGSTAVPGLTAKPIIDIAVLVNTLNQDFTTIISKLKELEYIYKPKLSSGERLFFRKGNPSKYHLSISSRECDFLDRQLLFRDYLRKHPEQSKRYGDLKLKIAESLSKQAKSDLSLSPEYTDRKTFFIQKILKLAREELGGFADPETNPE